MKIQSPQSFLETFVWKYGPNNFSVSNKLRMRKGEYASVYFEVIETRNRYGIKIEDKTRYFTNAWDAGRWVIQKAMPTIINNQSELCNEQKEIQS